MQGTKLLSEQTADKICKYIEEHGLKPGDKLPNEFQLAEQCEVGRSTIREAIKLLIFSGQVEVVRGSGTYIRKQVEPKDVEMDANNDPIGLVEGSEENLLLTALEFMDVRLMLEPEIAAMAANNADKKDVERLEEIEAEVERCIRSGIDHIDADMQFHTQIAACTHNQVLCNLMEIVTKGIPLFVKITKNDYAFTTIEHHRNVMRSIREGDAQGARYGMIMHLNTNRICFVNALARENYSAADGAADTQ